MPGIQGVGGVYYAGAWCGYGFHEDGIRAAVAAVQAMGALYFIVLRCDVRFCTLLHGGGIGAGHGCVALRYAEWSGVALSCPLM